MLTTVYVFTMDLKGHFTPKSIKIIYSSLFPNTIEFLSSIKHKEKKKEKKRKTDIHRHLLKFRTH